MMQEELRQALAGLMPPPALAAANPPAAVAPATNPPAVDAPPANNDNARGQPLNATRNVPAVEIKFEDGENYMVEQAKNNHLSWFKTLNLSR